MYIAAMYIARGYPMWNICRRPILKGVVNNCICGILKKEEKKKNSTIPFGWVYMQNDRC